MTAVAPTAAAPVKNIRRLTARDSPSLILAMVFLSVP